MSIVDGPAWEKSYPPESFPPAPKKLTDTELLNWAEQHPEATKNAIDCMWANCGRGFRESFFNFRLAIEDAIKGPPNFEEFKG